MCYGVFVSRPHWRADLTEDSRVLRSPSLEHIADLAKRVSEEVVYLYEAEDIRHAVAV